jgi:hypothetical protein
MKRTKLADRALPAYSRGEELTNTITHAAGSFLSIVGLTVLIFSAVMRKNIWGISTGSLYGISLIAVFTVSAVYHGLTTDFSKKVMQVIDHCTIYFLIAGTYTVIVLTALRPVYPVLAWSLFGFQWTLAILAATLTAICYSVSAALIAAIMSALSMEVYTPSMPFSAAYWASCAFVMLSRSTEGRREYPSPWAFQAMVQTQTASGRVTFAPHTDRPLTASEKPFSGR